MKKADKKNIGAVLRLLANLCDAEPETAASIAEEMNDLLDELYLEDFFGTEGQLDPRGDQRDPS